MVVGSVKRNLHWLFSFHSENRMKKRLFFLATVIISVSLFSVALAGRIVCFVEDYGPMEGTATIGYQLEDGEEDYPQSIIVPDNVTVDGEMYTVGRAELTFIPRRYAEVGSFGALAVSRAGIIGTWMADWFNVPGYPDVRLQYTFSDSDQKIVSDLYVRDYDKTISTAVIPSGVTAIGDLNFIDAFAGCDNLISVTIPEGVTHIERGSFSRCANLSEVVLPESLLYINECFGNCPKLEAIYLPDGLERYTHDVYFTGRLYARIGSSAAMAVSRAGCDFYQPGNPNVKLKYIFNEDGSIKYLAAYHHDQNITEAVVPNGVTAIGEGAFSGCDELTSISIPEGVTIIQTNAFGSCEKLKEIHLPNSIQTIERSFSFSHTDICFSEENDQLTVCDTDPWYYYGHLVAGVGTNAAVIISRSDRYFYHKGNTGVKMIYRFDENDNITQLEGSAADTSVVDAVIPDGVTVIPDSAFSNCYDLESVNIPEGVTSIGQNAFQYTSISTIDLPESLVAIGKEAFRNCESLREVTIGPGIETMAEDAFIYAPIEKVNCNGFRTQYLKNGIDPDAFFSGTNVVYSYAAPEMFLPQELTTIESEAFLGIKHAMIHVPETVTSIFPDAFDESALIICTESGSVEQICSDLGLDYVSEIP